MQKIVKQILILIFILVSAVFFLTARTNSYATYTQENECQGECINYEWRCPSGYHEPILGNLCWKGLNHYPWVSYKSKIKICTEYENLCQEPTPTPTPTPQEECVECEETTPTPTDTPNPRIISDTSNPPQECHEKALDQAPVITQALMYNSTGCLEIDLSYGPEANGNYLYNIYVSPTGKDVRSYWNAADLGLNPVGTSDDSKLHYSFCQLPSGQKDLIACVQSVCSEETCSQLFVDDEL